MTDTPEDRDPFDDPAEEETDVAEFDPDEIEDDPAYDPDDDELKDIKGG